MNTIPLVTVILPTYNAGEHLEPAVLSILNQTFRQFELLIVDDGSTDGSVQRLATVVRDPRLTVLRKSNSGLADSLNVGIRIARGKLIARMDADDIAHVQRLELQVAHLQAQPSLVMLGTQVHRMVSGDLDSTSRFPLTHDSIVRGLLRGQHVVCHPSIVMRTDVVRAIGGYWRHGVAEDWDLYLRLSEVGDIGNLPDTLLDYRFHSGGINAQSMSLVRERIALAIANHHRRSDRAPELGPDEFQESMSAWTRLRVRREAASLRAYRTGLVARGWRQIFFLTKASAIWPEQASRRLLDVTVAAARTGSRRSLGPG